MVALCVKQQLLNVHVTLLSHHSISIDTRYIILFYV